MASGEFLVSFDDFILSLTVYIPNSSDKTEVVYPNTPVSLNFTSLTVQIKHDMGILKNILSLIFPSLIVQIKRDLDIIAVYAMPALHP